MRVRAPGPRVPRREIVAAAVAALALGATLATAAVPPPFLLGDDGVATTDDARAFLVNPAALGERYPSELWFGGARDHDDRTAWEVLATWRRLGFSMERDLAGGHAFGAGFSLGGERARLGWTQVLRTAAAPRDERVWDASAGLLVRPAPWLSLGGRMAHVLEPRIAGAQQVRTWTAGLGLRPFALSPARAHGAGVRFTLLGEVTAEEGESPRREDVRAGAALELVPGLELRAVGGEHTVQVGVTLRQPRSSVAGATRHRRDGSTSLDRVRWAVSAHAGEDRTVFLPRRDRRVARLRLAGPLADEALGGGLGGGGARPSGPVHRQLERALSDPLTRGVFLELEGVGGMAQLEELRPRLERLVRAGKPVVAYLEHGGTRGDLYLSSVATRVVASPAAEFVGLGLRTERRYWRRALERAGVRMDRASIGDFKSAYRNLSVDSTPPADTTVIERILAQRQQLFVDAVAKARGVPAERVEAVLDGREYPAEVLARLGVIDSVGWREDALAELGRLAGLGRKPRTVDLARESEADERWVTPRRVAVVYAGGPIVDGRSGSNLLDGDVMGDRTVTEQLERAFRAPGVRAVVLRIESPGGSASASYLMDHAVERLKRETGKPLVVSMGSVAASGGYFMSLHADRIYADRNTVTGSIGVVFVKPSFEGLYGKLGVRQDDFERGPYMGGLSWSRDWGPREQAAADSTIKRLYRTFMARVADGRRLEPFLVSGYAQGRAWMADDALDRKLVDGIGGLEAAIVAARRLGGVAADERIALLEFHRPRGNLLERALRGWLRGELVRTMSLPDLARAGPRGGLGRGAGGLILGGGTRRVCP